jgi:hypothetical protein
MPAPGLPISSTNEKVRIRAGTRFNGAFILWLQTRLSSADPNLENLMAAFAA